MTILCDMAQALAQARRERARKRSLGFPEPRPVFVVGNRDAFAAAMVRRYGPGADLSTFLDVPVEHGLPGVRVVWRT